MNCAEKITADNLLQFIHQVTIEFRFRKSLAQERFKSNLELRYQIIVSSIKFRKGFAKFMIPIALLKKFLSSQFIASVEVSNIARCSSKMNELRDIDSKAVLLLWIFDVFQSCVCYVFAIVCLYVPCGHLLGKG